MVVNRSNNIGNNKIVLIISYDRYMDIKNFKTFLSKLKLNKFLKYDYGDCQTVKECYSITFNDISEIKNVILQINKYEPKPDPHDPDMFMGFVHFRIFDPYNNNDDDFETDDLNKILSHLGSNNYKISSVLAKEFN